jgi:PAS domain-containing protein
MEGKKTTKERHTNQLETLDSEHEGTGKPGKAIVINYQALLDNINDGVYMLNKKGRFVFINRARQENLWVNSGSGSSPIVRNSAILRTS